jgi:hypothetical protein
MKVRSGFVSNSSSTSFVICVPDNLDIEKCALALLEENGFDKESYEEEFNVKFEGLVNHLSSIYNGRSFYNNGRFDEDEEIGDLEFFYESVFGGVIIASIDNGPDCDSYEYIKKSDLIAMIEEV